MKKDTLFTAATPLFTEEYKGVYYRKTTGRYSARVNFRKNGKSIQINIPGSFTTPTEAYKARIKYLNSLK